MTITPSTRTSLYWGMMPLPVGSIALGIIDRGNGDKGVLIQLANGITVQGNAGSIRSLPQSEVRTAMAEARVEMGV